MLVHPERFSFPIYSPLQLFVPLNTNFSPFISVAANSGVSASDVTVGTPNCTASNWDVEGISRGTVSCTTHKSVILLLQLDGREARSVAKVRPRYRPAEGLPQNGAPSVPCAPKAHGVSSGVAAPC